MDISTVRTISIIGFLLIIGFLALLSLLAIYVFIRYGRTRSITVMTSLAFTAVFVLGAITALASLLRIF